MLTKHSSLSDKVVSSNLNTINQEENLLSCSFRLIKSSVDFGNKSETKLSENNQGLNV